MRFAKKSFFVIAAVCWLLLLSADIFSQDTATAPKETPQQAPSGQALPSSNEPQASVDPAQPSSTEPLTPSSGIAMQGMQGNISLDLRNIDVNDALKFLVMKLGLNIITTKSVTGRVTLMVQNAPVQDVFDVMLRANNLAYDRRGDLFNVMSQDEYMALYGKKFADVREVKLFRLSYSIPEQVFSLFDMLKSNVGRVLVDPESGSVFVMDSPERIKMMEQILQSFEQKNIVRIFKLNYIRATEVEEILKSQLDLKKVGLIKSDERNNQVVVQTLPERMKQIEALIADLDKKTKEILVDSQIVQIKLTNDKDTGIEWEGLFDIARKLGFTYLGSYPFSSVSSNTDTFVSRQEVLKKVGYVGSYPFSGTTTSFNAGKKSIGTQEMHLGIVGKQDFDVVIKYLQKINNTRIISNPKLAIVNNQEAKIHVGQKEAYVTTTTTTGQTTNTVSEQVNFVDVGVMLSVVPTINYDDFITLKVKAEISSVVDTLITPTKNQIPIIDTSLAETTVLVKSGATVIIGGLRKEQTVDTVQQTPFFGRIPFIGTLFSSRSKNKDKTELLIMITPKLISGDALVIAAEKKVGEQGIKTSRNYAISKESDDISIMAGLVPPMDDKKIKKDNVDGVAAQPNVLVPAEKSELAPKGLRISSH